MAKARNPGARIEIKNGPMSIVADLPEQFALSVSQMFESRDQAFAAGDILAFSGLQERANAVLGVSAQVQALSYAVWRGSSPIEFSLQLIFDAETNAKQDVHENLVKLTALSLPGNSWSGGSSLLVPPIPGQWGEVSNYINKKIGGATTPTIIRVGKQFWFDNVAITSVSLSTETRLHNGMPIAGAIDLSVRTVIAYGKDDFYKASGYGPGGIP